ncbi:TRAP transporter substrate-binding protein DctP [Azohydromonas lata]|uniref:TRAP transporter substrate-binding protein DctP n=1 Tax=Azohydromonas lata TaxID=45677 RepID=A0ABU5IG87_9BURK|nr:TRAP transporter substrate-binding protein DctP [Azohydromonas lata]MDZ5456963.1 TRAP transporter substrate-binding protein DctP [Azohydromonas lata]
MLKPLLAALALGAAALAASAQTVWEAATPFPEKDFQAENLAQFAKDVESASGGKLKISIKRDAALKPADAKRAVQNGPLALADLRLADVQSEWATFGVDSVPLLASGYTAARKLYQAQRVPIGKKLAGQGLVMLYSVPSPPPGLFVKKPVSKLLELRELKWAAYSPATERMAKLVGAKPVALAADHVAQAVAQGQVDAALVAADGFNADAFEPMHAFVDLQAWLPRNGLLMNLKAFEALDKDTRAAVVKAAIAAEKRGWKESETRHTRFLGLIKDMGMDVVTPSEPLRTGLQKTVGEPMLDEWLQRTGPEGKQLIDDYRR